MRRATRDWERNLERLISLGTTARRLGANGRAHVARRYAMRTYQTQYLAVLARLAACGARPRLPRCDPRSCGILAGMPPLHVHQILNHYTPRQALDPGFVVLDNSANERPDWFEYWPIRKFLLDEALDENAFYGFLSPKFRVKTNLSAAAGARLHRARRSRHRRLLFSPSIHNSAYY